MSLNKATSKKVRKGVSLKFKLLANGTSMILLPLLAIIAVLIWQQKELSHTVEAESERQAFANLDHIVENAYSMCEISETLVQQQVEAALKTAKELVQNKGLISLDPEETTNWTAINQFTKEQRSIDLPHMLVGNEWMGQNSDPSTPSLIVDKVDELIESGTCTIFQRMNEQGDMVRVNTNITKADGKRAIGTYIPRTNPDGTPNAVISTVLQGKSFRGRAFVVNKWYATAYDPIFGEKGEVIGILYAGIPQQSVQTLRQALMDITIGESGYVYVLDSKGSYVVSKGGKRDGENIMNAKDADGNKFIQAICEKAKGLSRHEIEQHSYEWKNATDEKSQTKIVRIKYFEDWDWIIGASATEAEFNAAQEHIEEIQKHGLEIIIGVGIIALLTATTLWIFIATIISKRLNRAITQLNEGSTRVSSASSQINSSSQSLAEGASEQAASLEETSSSLEELSSMVKLNSENTSAANLLTNEATSSAQQGINAMNQMNEAIQSINDSSNEMAKIIQAIDNIAFQTNLLALNAAVEAARAGESGKGFAVVAEEVRNLAKQSAEAAKSTSVMIASSVKKAEAGVHMSAETSKILEDIDTKVNKAAGLVSEITVSSQEQAEGISQINIAIAQMDIVTQNNAAQAEESASASEELRDQAQGMNHTVTELQTLVNG